MHINLFSLIFVFWGLRKVWLFEEEGLQKMLIRHHP